MYLGLLGLGVLVTAAGASMIGFGIPINAFSFGNTLIVAGTTALVGGLILIGMATAVRQLRRIADALGRPVAVQTRPAEAAAEVATSPAMTPATAPAPAGAVGPVPPAASPRIPYPPKPRFDSPREPRPERAPVPPIAELTPASKPPTAGRDLRLEPRGAPSMDMPPRPTVEGPGRDFRLEPRVAAPSMDITPKPTDGPGRDMRSEPRVAAPPIDASDEHMPRDRRPAPPEPPRRSGEPPMVAESDEVPLSPRPSTRPALSLPPSIAEVFGSRSWSGSRNEGSVAEAPSAAHQDTRQDIRQDNRPDMRPAPALEPPSGSFDAMWPADPRPGVTPKSEGAERGPRFEAPRPEETAGQEKRADSQPAPEPTSEPPQPSVILKSGVIDGMAYTLYADGSISANLPQGTMRFASVEALRAHLDKGS